MSFDLDTELAQYVETALWSSTDEHDVPLDRTYVGADDLAPEALASMRADVEAFLADEELVHALTYWQATLGVGQIGHDLWLTRNGHGAGFWDRFGGQQEGARFGELLTAAAKVYGDCDLYVGDDGKIYCS